MKAIVELMRIRHWIKNGFVVAPLFFSSELQHSAAVLRSASAFAAFCLMASAVYIFNDWRDLEADRQHSSKKLRPLASRRVSVRSALLLCGVLAAAAVTIAVFSGLPKAFLGILAAYVAINIAYSLGLKHISLVELFLVASGFLLRLLAGAYVVPIQLSPWIIIATGMLALLLTAGKRRADIVQQSDFENRRKSLTSYNLPYLDLVLASLTGATIVVYLLFCVSEYAVDRFGRPVAVTAVPVVFGLLRYLQVVVVKGEGESPTDLVVGDPGIIAALIVFVIIFAKLIYF